MRLTLAARLLAAGEIASRFPSLGCWRDRLLLPVSCLPVRSTLSLSLTLLLRRCWWWSSKCEVLLVFVTGRLGARFTFPSKTNGRMKND
ncbi:hypothetical protein QYF36_002904 [Acer negundo]|nr:hypothetical protein QYF36_002904 [Acer negundo]